MTSFQAYTLDFLPEDLNSHELSGDAIRVHRFILESWLQRNDVNSDKPLLAHLTSPIGITRICCVGGPHFQDREQVYVPHWIMEQLGIESGTTITIEILAEVIPSASMIYLKPLDNAIYHTDIRECFEKALDMFHVLEVGTMLTVEIESLGGYKVEAYVDRLEPAHVCRLGGEVGVEFLEPDGGVPEFIPRCPTPPPTEPDTPILTPSENAIVDGNKDDDKDIAKNSAPNYKKIQEEVRASWLKKFKK